jgi:hypothetical protein
LGLDPAAMTLLVFGGSQGARALNRLAGEVLPSFCRSAGWQVIHFAGRAEAEAMEKAYAQTGVRAFVRPYFDDMAAAYSAADFVVGRSGAGTVMEIHRMGRRALLVPFPHATDAHQEANARFLEKTGAAAVVLEKDLSPDMLLSLLSSLPTPAVLREEARRRARGRRGGRPGALKTGLRSPVALAVAWLAAAAASAVSPADRLTWAMEAAPVFLALAVIAATWRRFPLTDLLCGLVFLHGLVLLLGGPITRTRKFPWAIGSGTRWAWPATLTTASGIFSKGSCRPWLLGRSC